MARISTYSTDLDLNVNDKLVGSERYIEAGVTKFRTKNYRIGDLSTFFGLNSESINNRLSAYMGVLNEDGSFTYSQAFANQALTTIATAGYASASFVTNLGAEVGTLNADGTLASLSQAFANQVLNVTSSTKFASTSFATTLAGSFGTYNPDGSIASLSTSFADSVLSTMNTSSLATASSVVSLNSRLNIILPGGGTVLSESFAQSVLTTMNTATLALASDTTRLSSKLNITPNTTRATSAPTITQALSSTAQVNGATVKSTSLAVDNISSGGSVSVGNILSGTGIIGHVEVESISPVVLTNKQTLANDVTITFTRPQTPAMGSLWVDTTLATFVGAVNNATRPKNQLYILQGSAGSAAWLLTQDTSLLDTKTGLATANESLSAVVTESGSTATKTISLGSKFGGFNANTGAFTFDSTASGFSEMTAHSDANSATSSKVTNLAASFGSFTNNTFSLSSTYFSDIATGVNLADKAENTHVQNLGAVMGVIPATGLPSNSPSAEVIGTWNTSSYTQTVDGAVTKGISIVLDSITNVRNGQKVSGLSDAQTFTDQAKSPVLVYSIDADSKTLTLTQNITVSDGQTLTFTGVNVFEVDTVSNFNPVPKQGFLVVNDDVFDVDHSILTITGPSSGKFTITLNKDLITNLAENTVVKFFGISASVLRSASALVDLQGNAKSSYSLKVDANGSIASMQLLAEANADGTTSSSVAFAADKFKVFNNTSGIMAGVAPFEISGGLVKIKSANIGTVSFGDLSNIPSSFVTTVIYADNTSGLNATTNPSGKNFVYFHNAATSWSSGDTVSGFVFKQVTGNTGAGGDNAKAVSLTSNQYRVEYNGDGVKTAVAITLTATQTNHESTIYYDFLKNGTSKQNGTGSTYAIPDSEEAASGSSNNWVVNTREGASSGTVIAFDTIDIFGLQQGSDAYTVFLTNESHSFAGNSSGVPTSYSGGEFEIRFFRGITQYTLASSGSDTYSIVSETVTGISITSSTVNNQRKYIPSSATATSGKAVIVVKDNATNTQFTKTYSFSVSAKGSTGDADNGDDGAPGANGDTVASGIIWFYAGASSTPGGPTVSNQANAHAILGGTPNTYNISTNVLTPPYRSTTDYWLRESPEMSAGTATNQYWTSAYRVVHDPDANSGNGTTTISYGAPIRAFAFNQVVTFNSTSNQIDGSTIINGDKITSGSIRSANINPSVIRNGAGTMISPTNYTTSGTVIDLVGGAIFSKNFKITTSGDASFKGDMSAGSNNSIFKATASGIQLGHATFSSADFSVTAAGVLKTVSGTVGGWTLDDNKLTSVSNKVTIDSSNSNLPGIETSIETQPSGSFDGSTVEYSKSFSTSSSGGASVSARYIGLSSGSTVSNTSNQNTANGWDGAYPHANISFTANSSSAGIPLTIKVNLSNSDTFPYLTKVITTGVNSYDFSGTYEVKVIMQIFRVDTGDVIASTTKLIGGTSPQEDSLGNLLISVPDNNLMSVNLSSTYLISGKTYYIKTGIQYVRLQGTFGSGGSRNITAYQVKLTIPKSTAGVLVYAIGRTEIIGGGLQVIKGSDAFLSLNRSQNTDTNPFILSRGFSRHQGDLYVEGSLDAGSKNFKIKHPLASKHPTHYLVHSSIESPRADLIYRGKVKIFNEVTLVNIDEDSNMTSGTFEALCRNVQCFTTNETSWGAIKARVEGNLLIITAKEIGSCDTISWMVVGERKDASIYESNNTDNNGRLIVELEK